VKSSRARERLDYLGCRADVLTIDPHTLAEVLASVEELGRATGTSGWRLPVAGRSVNSTRTTSTYSGSSDEGVVGSARR